MPRGQKRSEIEILQAKISEAQKRKERNLDAAAKEKQEINRLEKEINKKMAGEIALACRTKGIPLESVLNWILEQPEMETPPAAAKPGKKTAKPARKPAAKKPARRKTATKKPAIAQEPAPADPAAAE